MATRKNSSTAAPTSTGRRCRPGQRAMIIGKVNTGKIVLILQATQPEAPYFLRYPWLVESLGSALVGCDSNCQPGAGQAAHVPDADLMPLLEDLEPVATKVESEVM